MFPVDLQSTHPGSDCGVLAVIQLEHARVVRDELDKLPPEDVAAAQGVGDVSITEFVPGVSPLAPGLHGGSSIEKSPVEKWITGRGELLRDAFDVNKCVIVTFQEEVKPLIRGRK